MTTKTTAELRIGSVKLNQGGLKGLTVSYEQTEIKNNREFFTEFPGVKKKYPIHKELEDCFGWLKGYLLDICNYSQDKDEREALIQSTEITGVKYNSKGFVISGKMTTISDKTFAINTPNMTEADGYDDYDKVIAILDGIYAETKEYMGGNKMMSDKEYVVKSQRGNAEFDIMTFDSLPAEEQMRIATELMVKNKCMVIPMGDLVVVSTTDAEVEKEDPHVSVDTIISDDSQMISDPVGTAAELMENTPSKEAVIVQMTPENDFILQPIIELKPLPAKKARKVAAK